LVLLAILSECLFNFKFELMLLFTEYFKIVLERFRSSLLHYRYMDGILTVVRACPETTLDYSNYILVYCGRDILEGARILC
jgi:hypothetical protein